VRTQPAPAPDRAPQGPHRSCLVLRSLTVGYGRRIILRGVSADIPRGELVSIVGANGTGKSTLLKAIAGLLPLVDGTIELFGRPIDEMRSHVAYVPQREEVDWSFPVSVRDVVMMGRYPRLGWFRPARPEDEAAVDAALEELGIADLARRHVSELSGGQQRRTFIARAVAQEPDVVLLDEPMSGIDAATHDRILELFDDWRRRGKVIVQATHGDVHGESMIVLRRRGDSAEAARLGHHAADTEEHHGAHAH
jgi:ABC-type Mn2+/Zn2+ transport system ATPase subunit